MESHPGLPYEFHYTSLHVSVRYLIKDIDPGIVLEQDLDNVQVALLTGNQQW